LTHALAVREQALGPSHPDVANSLNNLAALYKDQGAYAQAEPLYTRAVAIIEKTLGPSHPLVATNLTNLARLYRDQGAYTRAEPLYIRALANREQALGPSHPLVARSLTNLAMLYQAQGAYAQVEPLFTRAADIQEQQLRTELVRLSESRKRALMTLLQNETEVIVSLHASPWPTCKPHCRRARCWSSLCATAASMPGPSPPGKRSAMSPIS
jgi:tetratricopeptide (TPR) repeat protein